ncbi:MAG: helix-hairpin-helix domain-containing protein [Acidobacteria bacterium]|nr:helix-hairpin-helix domain-containing protein [Acidobacteriota bacterium]
MMGRVDAQVGKAKTTIDPNVAGEKELAALPHMNATLAQSLIKRRPFLSMTDFNAFLSQSLKGPQLTELYGRLFVPLNLNTATREEILMIPNVGDRMVREFFEYRPFKSLAQWHREIDKYVDDAELARLEQYVFVPIDLNTASDADILTIPGLGKRMLHEFKEYRPYKSIEQFRREMGKYVSKQEVARLERYVRID